MKVLKNSIQIISRQNYIPRITYHWTEEKLLIYYWFQKWNINNLRTSNKNTKEDFWIKKYKQWSGPVAKSPRSSCWNGWAQASDNKEKYHYWAIKIPRGKGLRLWRWWGGKNT